MRAAVGIGSERVVLDTNVLISAALIAAGNPSTVLRAVLDTSVLVFSNETFEEVATRLSRAKFDGYAGVTLRERFLVELGAVAEWTTITGALRVCRDPDDDAFLETAVAGRADCLVTGNRDLLTLNPFRDVAIITPTDFLATRG